MLRNVHRWAGLLLAPLLLLTGLAGGMLLWRRSLYGADVDVHAIVELHNFEMVGDYVGVVVAGGMVFMAVSGVALFLQVVLRKRKARRKTS